MVTLPPQIAEHGPTAFAVYADEMVLNERTRMYEFKFQGRRVVEIAQELVHQYMVDQARPRLTLALTSTDASTAMIMADALKSC